MPSLVTLPWWGYVLVTLGLTHVTIASVTIFLHRHQAHRALELHPAIGHFFRFWLWLTTGMKTRQWVAVHRKHHARVETPEDPHSPYVVGIGKVLLEGAELYRREAVCERTLAEYGQGTPDDWIERKLYNRHSAAGIFLMLGIDAALFGPIGITIWAIQMIWIPFFAAGVINGLGHWWGYRNFEPADGSTNIVPWGILIGGEEMHNNHHAFSYSAKFSCRKWEFDIGWLYIRVMERLRLVRVCRVQPQPVTDSGKQELDLDALAAILSNRFHVMAKYANAVMARVYRDEWRKADASTRRLLKRARKWLHRDKQRLDQAACRQVQELLDSNRVVRVVHEYKEKLSRLLHARGTVSHERSLQLLRDWHRQARQTGIQALTDFAEELHCYTMQPVPATSSPSSSPTALS